VELAEWTPPPLLRLPFVYYLGRQAERGEPLECSCLLAEHVDWTTAEPVVDQDETYSPHTCAFDALRRLCDEATQDGGLATIVCDDSGGLRQTCTEDDYCAGLIRLGSIARGNLMFGGPGGEIPWRVSHVVR
jgi:hypothetical protein